MVDAPAPTPANESGRGSLIGWGIVLVLLAVIAVGLTRAVMSHQASTNLIRSIAAGNRPPAPALPVHGLDDQVAHNVPLLAGHAPGTITVVNFWASWCGPCKKEAATLAKIAQADQAQGVRFVGIDAQDASSDAQAFVREYHVSYPILHASDSEKNAWGVTGFPETFVVGKDGRVSAHIIGPVSAASLNAEISREIGRKA